MKGNKVRLEVALVGAAFFLTELVRRRPALMRAVPSPVSAGCMVCFRPYNLEVDQLLMCKLCLNQFHQVFCDRCACAWG